MQTTQVEKRMKQSGIKTNMVSVFVTREIKIPHEITGTGLYSRLNADPTDDIITLINPLHPEIKGGYLISPDNVPMKFLSIHGLKTLPDFMFLVTKAGETILRKYREAING